MRTSHGNGWDEQLTTGLSDANSATVAEDFDYGDE
jgi:hypothetical protein